MANKATDTAGQEMSQQAQHMTQLGASRLQGIHLGFLAARMKSWPKGPKTLGESEKLVIMFDEYLSYIHSTSALWICDTCVYMYVCLYIYMLQINRLSLFFIKQCVTDDKWRPCWDDRSSKMGQFCPVAKGFRNWRVSGICSPSIPGKSSHEP